MVIAKDWRWAVSRLTSILSAKGFATKAEAESKTKQNHRGIPSTFWGGMLPIPLSCRMDIYTDAVIILA